MKLFVVSLVVAGTFSCVLSPPGPKGSDQTVVGIHVTVRQTFLESLWQGSREPDAIYFVPIETGESYRQQRVFVSNHRLDDYYYLVNADSGQYAAVGARRDFHYEDSETGASGHYLGSEFWAFPENMIDETIVDVEPSGVVFMGEFELSGELPPEDADDTQKHYFKLFMEASAPRDLFSRLLAPAPFRDTVFIDRYQPDQSEKATERFLQSSQPLADAGWRIRTAP